MCAAPETAGYFGSKGATLGVTFGGPPKGGNSEDRRTDALSLLLYLPSKIHEAVAILLMDLDNYCML